MMEDTYTVRDVQDAQEWDVLLSGLPNAHLLQTWAWADLKRETHWHPYRLAFDRAGQTVACASLVRRHIVAGRAVAYCNKGPALDYGDRELFRRVLAELVDVAKRGRCIFLRIDPDAEEGDEQALAAMRSAGFRPAREQVQTRATVICDLRGTEQDLLERMSATWRRYIRKAARAGVLIREARESDISRFVALIEETEQRQGFVARPNWYYRAAYSRLVSSGVGAVFLAEVNGQPEAALFAGALGKRAWYLYGGASEVGLKAHASYLLQWHTMQWARGRGCESYDMWGAPDHPEDVSDPLSGVYFFKQGFGGSHVRMAGTYDYVVSPLLYRAWEFSLPYVLALLRRLRGEQAGRTRPVLGRV